MIKNYLTIGSFFVLAVAAFGCGGDPDNINKDKDKDNKDTEEEFVGVRLTFDKAEHGPTGTATSISENDLNNNTLNVAQGTPLVIILKAQEVYHNVYKEDGKNHKKGQKVGNEILKDINESDMADDGSKKYKVSKITNPATNISNNLVYYGGSIGKIKYTARRTNKSKLNSVQITIKIEKNSDNTITDSKVYDVTI